MQSGDNPLKQAVVFGPRTITVSDDTVNRWLFDIAPESTIVYIGVAPLSNASSPVKVRFALSLRADLNTSRFPIQLVTGYPSTSGAFTKAAVWTGRFLIPEREEYVLEIAIHNRSGSEQSWSAVVILELDKND